jgi:predicted site-specific integrase-resolvase
MHTLKGFVAQFKSVQEAADILGVSRRTLYYWMKEQVEPGQMGNQILEAHDIKHK